MKDLLHSIGVFLAVIGWIAGTILALGWWKLVAVLFFPYAWYLAVERVMLVIGIL